MARIVTGCLPMMTLALLMCAAITRVAVASANGELRDDLKNLTYPSDWTRRGQALLIDGIYEEPAAPGSASKIVVRLTEFIAAGTIGVDAVAAAVTVTDAGGSGVFFDLYLLQQRERRWNVVDRAFLGDRVRVNGIKIEQGLVVLDLIVPGPGDALCCPTKPESVRYALKDGRLVKIEAPPSNSQPR